MEAPWWVPASVPVPASGQKSLLFEVDKPPLRGPTNVPARRPAPTAGELNGPAMFPRFLRNGVELALLGSPVVLLGGARQTGKTTLARELCATAVTLDDVSAL